MVAHLRLLEGMSVGEASRTVPLPGGVALPLIVTCIPPVHVERVMARGGSYAAGWAVAFVLGPPAAEAGVGAGACAQSSGEFSKMLLGEAGSQPDRSLLWVAVGGVLRSVQQLPLTVEVHAGPPLTVPLIGAVQRRVAAVQVGLVGCAEPQALSRAQALQNKSMVLGLGARGAGGLAAAARLVRLLQHFGNERGRDSVGVGVTERRLLHVHGQSLLKISRQLEASEKREAQEHTCLKSGSRNDGEHFIILSVHC